MKTPEEIAAKVMDRVRDFVEAQVDASKVVVETLEMLGEYEEEDE